MTDEQVLRNLEVSMRNMDIYMPAFRTYVKLVSSARSEKHAAIRSRVMDHDLVLRVQLHKMIELLDEDSLLPPEDENLVQINSDRKGRKLNMKRISCVHCKQENTIAIIRKYHNDRCKYKPQDALTNSTTTENDQH